MIKEPSRRHLFDIFLLVFQTSQPIKHVLGCDIFLLVFQTSQPIKRVQGCNNIFLLVFQTSQPIKRVQGCNNIFLLVFQSSQPLKQVQDCVHFSVGFPNFTFSQRKQLHINSFNFCLFCLLFWIRKYLILIRSLSLPT